MTERMSTAQGALTDIAGDTILVLNPDLQVLWAWDSFDHLDISRKAVLNETCITAPDRVRAVQRDEGQRLDARKFRFPDLRRQSDLLGPPPGHGLQDRLRQRRRRWPRHLETRQGRRFHVAFLRSLSMVLPPARCQVRLLPASVSMFDNGNTRVSQFGGNSRGMVLSVDEGSLTITPAISADLGGYSAALGSAQRLSNGNYDFGSGIVGRLADQCDRDDTHRNHHLVTQCRGGGLSGLPAARSLLRAVRPAALRARRKTSVSIFSVSLPVEVFCWLGW